MSEILETIRRIIVAPEPGLETVAHELVEFVTYGSIFHVLANKVKGWLDESDSEEATSD